MNSILALRAAFLLPPSLLVVVTFRNGNMTNISGYLTLAILFCLFFSGDFAMHLDGLPVTTSFVRSGLPAYYAAKIPPTTSRAINRNYQLASRLHIKTIHLIASYMHLNSAPTHLPMHIIICLLPVCQCQMLAQAQTDDLLPACTSTYPGSS